MPTYKNLNSSNKSLNKSLDKSSNKDKITTVQDAFLMWLIEEQKGLNKNEIQQLKNSDSKIYKLESLTAKDLLKIKEGDYLEGLGFIKQSHIKYLIKYRRAIIKELRKSLNLEKLKEELKEELKGELNNEDIETKSENLQV